MVMGGFYLLVCLQKLKNKLKNLKVAYKLSLPPSPSLSYTLLLNWGSTRKHIHDITFQRQYIQFEVLAYSIFVKPKYVKQTSCSLRAGNAEIK